MSLPVIGRYEIRRGLGRGAMGSVYLAFDAKVGREVAIKVLQRDVAQNEKHRMRFDREARAIGALHHPNIVEIYDYGGSPDHYLYLVMELIHGPDTGRLCREHGPFPESVLAAVGCELAAALSHAHRAGLIHRDIRPENVFLDRGRLVLADFGIAKAIVADNPLGREAASPKTDVVGTPGFMAPEQLLGQPLDGRTDLFALGALLYYLASKRLPYPAESPYELMKEFRETRPLPLSELRPDLSDDASLLVQACLEVSKEHRPARADLVRKKLRQILDDLGAPDVRDVLAKYEASPLEFRIADRERAVAHLVQRLK
ncbi:MAG: serine/threonine protein kinase, partial [Deltaproteobacteria bacterium]|nr:serine/threonine protein kinase [Deltaproteobacteria bacterium]